MKDAHKLAVDKAKEAQEQIAREARAEALRGSGKTLPANEKETSIIRRPAPGYVRDIDLSHWATSWLEAESLQIKHSADGGCCLIEVVSMNKDASEVHASIKEKNQKRALFYDISLVLNIKGR